MQSSPPLIISSWPRAILHLDADAFFASCEQAIHPELKGRPVITGKERGIVAAASYEAKALGVQRGTRLFEVKKICPDAVILPSDYETAIPVSAKNTEIMRPRAWEFLRLNGWRRCVESATLGRFRWSSPCHPPAVARSLRRTPAALRMGRSRIFTRPHFILDKRRRLCYPKVG